MHKRGQDEPEVTSETAGDEPEVEELDEDSAEPGEASDEPEGEDEEPTEEQDEEPAKPAKRTKREPESEPEPEPDDFDDEDESPATDASSQFEQRLQAEAVRLRDEHAAIKARLSDPTADRDKIIIELDENRERQSQLTLAAMAHGQRKHELEVFAMRLPRGDRAEFKKFAMQQGHRASDLKMLRLAFEGRKARSSSKQTKATVEQARKVIAAKDRGVVSTVKRPVTAMERKSTKPAPMTEAQYDAEEARLTKAGDTNGLLALSRKWATQHGN